MAITTVGPTLSGVTGTITLVLFAGIVTVAGTVATLGLVLIRFKVKPPAGAIDDRVSVSLSCTETLIVMIGPGLKLSVPPTKTKFVWSVE